MPRDASGSRRSTSSRLTGSGDIRRAVQHGSHVGDPAFVVHAVARPDVVSDATRGWRTTVVAGKRCGNAVVRNRMKRRLRAVLQSVTQNHAAVDVVVVARPGLVNVTHTELVNRLERALNRAIERQKHV